MFTGLIEEVGMVKSICKNGRGFRLRVSAQKILEGSQLGDSISTNGICLTIVEKSKFYFVADLMPETAQKTTIKHWKSGTLVNLERALVVGKRLGGHEVSGHVHEALKVKGLKKDSNAIRLTLECPRAKELTFNQASVAIDGASLTVASVENQAFTISLIPHTLRETHFNRLKVGQWVNVEYAQEPLKKQKRALTEGFLMEHGF